MANIIEYINSEATRITNGFIMDNFINGTIDTTNWDKVHQTFIAFGKDVAKEILHDIDSGRKPINKFIDEIGGRVEPQVSLPSRTWIKIKDKLPEYNKDVIAIRNCPEPVYKLARLTCGKWTDNKPMWDIDGLDLLLHLEYFDYWMNLPEQPKG